MNKSINELLPDLNRLCMKLELRIQEIYRILMDYSREEDFCIEAVTEVQEMAAFINRPYAEFWIMNTTEPAAVSLSCYINDNEIMFYDIAVALVDAEDKDAVIDFIENIRNGENNG